MFGNTKEKTALQPPPVLPEGVVFHVMPGKYQGVKRAYTPPSPPEVKKLVPVASTPSQTQSQAQVSPTPQAAPIVRPAALVGGKKMLMLWGTVAVVVLGGGGFAAFFLVPGKPKPALQTSEEVGTQTPASSGVKVEQQPEPVPTPSPEPVPPPEIFPLPLQPAPTVDIVSSTDTDADGLTDVEEALYTTQPAKADMDGDGYLDGQEVMNLYNPTGNAPIRLADSTLVTRYRNPTFGYTILYPTSWTARALDEKNPREILFTATTGEFIQVIVDDNIEGLSAVQWYAKQFPNVLPESLERIFVDNLEGVWTKDKSTVYLTRTTSDASGKRLLFGITYNYGERTSVNFRTTFAMMMKSFLVL